MKVLKRIICIVLSLSMAFAFAACKKNKGNTVVIPEEPTDEFTDTDLVKGGETDYKLVIPENAVGDLLFTAQDFESLFEEATGADLDVVPDTGMTFDENAKVLSLGDTTVLNGSGLTVNRDELGPDGLRLVTKGNTVLMTGGGERGAMYAAYEFLERTFAFESYAEDEYYIDTDVTDLALKKFDITEVPVFDRRSVGLYSYTKSRLFRNRMRQELFNEGWIYWSHSHFKIMPVEKYFLAHPDWYSNDGAVSQDGKSIVANPTQLCLTNDEMREEFTKNVIELMDAHPECDHIMLGQEDIRTFCDCPTCREQKAIYKASGVMMHFINKVGDDIQKHIDESDNPDRVFYICTFGYHETEQAPANYDAETDTYTPIDETVIPHENVMVMVAPISTCYAHGLYDACNMSNGSDKIIKSWKAVASNHMYFWIYNKAFSYYFIPYDNFGSVVPDYEILKDVGAKFVYHQGNKETEAGGLQALNSYVQAKLMWDDTQVYNDLVEKFAVAYYKDAAEGFLEYFNQLRLNYTLWEEQGFHAYPTGSGGDIYDVNKYWTKNYLDSLNLSFDKMMNAIEHYKNTDPSLYETLAQRINVERLTVYYFYLESYFGEFTSDELENMIDVFETTCLTQGILVYQEEIGGIVAKINDKVASWRAELLDING